MLAPHTKKNEGRMREMKGIPYPDNLWAAIFGDDAPVPPDAEETLDLLMREIDNPLTHTIFDLRFKEGKTYIEIANEVGRSRERVRQVIYDATRKMRHPLHAGLSGAKLKYGVSAGHRLADGKAEICFECGKLINDDSPIYLVPSDNARTWQGYSFSQAFKVCCSSECAVKSVEWDLNNHREILLGMAQQMDIHRAAISRLEEYHPSPLSISDARCVMFEEGLPRLRQSEYEASMFPASQSKSIYLDHSYQKNSTSADEVAESEGSQGNEAFDNIPIEKIGLPERVCNILLRKGCKTIADIIKIGPEKIRKTRNCDRKSYISIIDALERNGVNVTEWSQFIDKK